MMNHYYDENGVYTTSADANPGSLPPDNAIRIAPPQCVGYWPVIKPGRDGWDMLEDHRGLDGWLNREKHTIAELGPLPEGWSITSPPKTEEELKQERIAMLKMQLADIDTRSARSLRAIIAGTATDIDHQAIATLELAATTLRVELATLLA